MNIISGDKQLFSLLPQGKEYRKEKELLRVYWKPQYHKFQQKRTKINQSLLLLILWKALSSGNSTFNFNQRIIAKKLQKHYNSIYLAIKEGRKNNDLELINEMGTNALTVNLESATIIRYLLVLSEGLYKKVNTKQQQITLEDKETDYEELELSLDYDLFEKDINYLLANKQGFAYQLAEMIIDELSEAKHRTEVFLEEADLKNIIHQVLLNCTELLAEPVENFLTGLDKSQQEITRKKMSKG